MVGCYIMSNSPIKYKDSGTDLEIAEIVLTRIGSKNLITDPTNTVYYWNRHNERQGWQLLHKPELSNLIRLHLMDIAKKPTVTMVNNVTTAIKQMTYERDPEFNISHNHIISFNNGDLELIDNVWILSDTRKENRRITRIPHDYDKDATAPKFCEFLDSIFENDPDSLDKQQLILELLGYSLQTHARYELFVLLVGTGANGKSVLIDTVRHIVGVQNVAAVQPTNFENNFQKATLRHKLVNAVTESEQGAKLPTAQVKAIVSGEPMTVEHKNQDPFVMSPFATLWWATNHLPHAHDYSEAVYRRVKIIEFNRQFNGKERNTNLHKELRDEASGIITMALTAYKGAVKNGFTIPDSVVKAKHSWRIKSDSVALWAEECVETVMLETVGAREAYNHYKFWCGELNYKPVTEVRYSDRMKMLHHPKKKVAQGMIYENIRLMQG